MRIQCTHHLSLLLLLLTPTTIFHHLLPTPTLVEASIQFTTTATTDDDPATATFLRTSCGTTLYPDLCYSSLSRYSNAIRQNPGALARVAVAVSLSKAHRMASYISRLSGEADYGLDSRAASALRDCFSNLGDAVDEIRGSLKQMRQIGGAGAASVGRGGGEQFRFQMSNVQTWMSAALTDEDTCTDGFEDVPEGSVKTDVCDRVTYVKKFTSNALALRNILDEPSSVVKHSPKRRSLLCRKPLLQVFVKSLEALILNPDALSLAMIKGSGVQSMGYVSDLPQAVFASVTFVSPSLRVVAMTSFVAVVDMDSPADVLGIVIGGGTVISSAPKVCPREKEENKHARAGDNVTMSPRKEMPHDAIENEGEILMPGGRENSVREGSDEGTQVARREGKELVIKDSLPLPSSFSVNLGSLRLEVDLGEGVLLLKNDSTDALKS
ncbi:21 kDa protein-like [Senna tora]|uniref:21 kDa protein-like n=1 Tax=Senna tora TaxID=362788 RepID=A0A834TUA4_9FABA|nr:21 kDa protein-like [Senna tora]